MKLVLYNSFTRTKEEFKPFQKNKTSLYVCGITPDNAAHLGHAFTYVSFDILVRYLKYSRYEVEYLQNATDINDSDDVIKQAKADGRTWREEAEYWISHFHKQMDALHVLRPTHYVLATSVIDKIIEVNLDLIKKGFAYESGGNLYFEVKKFKKYGELSHLTPSQMLRVPEDRGTNIHDANKRDPLDFVLWFGDVKKPNWDSPWGKGRPGWHIECSTMINSILGSQIDIHGGGEDLMYPHHESEIAQSESYTGESPFVATWMHTAYVLFEGEKMSKSLGNLILIEDLLKKYSSDAIRWTILSHHYRKQWEFDEKEIKGIEKKVQEIKKKLNNITMNYAPKTRNQLGEFEFLMNDDLNTSEVLKLVEKLVDENKIPEAKKILEVLGFVL